MGSQEGVGSLEGVGSPEGVGLSEGVGSSEGVGLPEGTRSPGKPVKCETAMKKRALNKVEGRHAGQHSVHLSATMNSTNV